MQMTVVGAGTALPDAERDNTSLVWQAGTDTLLIDCGGRCYQQLLRAGIAPLDLRAVLLTHTHPDHIYGFPALVFHLWLAGYTRTLEVYGDAPTLTMVRQLCEVMQLPAKGYMCAVSWHELPQTPEHPVFATAAYSVWTTPVVHSVPCLAVKIQDHTTGRTLVHSSDTEPCAELERFAQGAHTLIHEATTYDANEHHGHSTPFQAGAIAARLQVETLILIHYSSVYTMPEAEALAQIRAAGFAGRALPAVELDSYAA